MYEDKNTKLISVNLNVLLDFLYVHSKIVLIMKFKLFMLTQSKSRNLDQSNDFFINQYNYKNAILNILYFGEEKTSMDNKSIYF